MKLKLLLSLSFIYASSNAQDNKERLTVFSKNIAKYVINENYENIVALFDSTLSINLTEENLAKTFKDAREKNGKIIHVGEPVIEFYDNGNAQCFIPLQFEKKLMLLYFPITPNEQLHGFYLTTQQPEYIIPEYVQSLSFLETKIPFGKEGWKLPGILSYPNDTNKHPLVIILHDSGPLDKDGTKGGSKIYRDIAWGMASQGICAFRYSKRSNVHGSRLFMETYKGLPYTAQDEIVDDALAAIKLMSINEHVDATQIYIIAHGQGGMMAPLILKQNTIPIEGLILLGANARPLQDVMIAQMNYLYPDGGEVTINQYKEKTDIIKQATYAKNKKLKPDAPSDSLPFGVRGGYWIYLNKYNITKTFAKTSTPTLILHGERDYQSTKADFDLWKKTAGKRKGKTHFISYPTLNHLFIDGIGPSKPTEYRKLANIDRQVLKDIQQWMMQPK
jgi:dienelactone hydrolase